MLDFVVHWMVGMEPVFLHSSLLGAEETGYVFEEGDLLSYHPDQRPDQTDRMQAVFPAWDPCMGIGFWELDT